MKIIDILQKIANGEEVKFKVIDDIEYYCKADELLHNEYGEEVEWMIDSYWLNKKVEIIEEDKKIPEKIIVWYDPIKDTKLERHDIDTSIEILANMCNDLKDKYNEIIDYLHSKGDE